jgi:hypothetical protein
VVVPSGYAAGAGSVTVSLDEHVSVAVAAGRSVVAALWPPHSRVAGAGQVTTGARVSTIRSAEEHVAWFPAASVAV